MTGTQCGSCGAGVKDGYLCRRCGRELREALADLAPGRSVLPLHVKGPAGRGTSTLWDAPSAVLVGGLGDQLETTVARLARIGSPGKRGKGDLGPPSFHEAAAEIRSSLVNLLGPWAAWMLELERPTPRPPTCSHRDPVGADCRACAVDVAREHAVRRAKWARAAAVVRQSDVGGMAAYLLERVNVLEGQEEAPTLHAAVVATVRRLQRVIDRPGDRLAVGECGAELATEMVCRRQLYADPTEAFVVCPACKMHWSVANRRTWLLAAANDSLGTAATIATALTRLEQPVTADRIYQWKKRGRLKVHGNEPPPPCRDHQGKGRQPLACKACAAREGAPLYRLGDVVDLLVEAARAEVARARKKAAKKAS